MTPLSITQQRLAIQAISTTQFKTPAEVVAWMGGLQGQDYAGVKWSIALRLPEATEADIELAISDRSIVRSGVMRGTLFIVPPADLRWMLTLLASRITQTFSANYRLENLTPADFSKSNKLLAQAMQGGKQLTRKELAVMYEQNGIPTGGMRVGYLLQQAIFEQLVCLGERRGKEFTYVLLDEWLPPTKPLSRDDSLAELALRYFTSRGPATEQDFMWWSKLTVQDVKTAMEMVKPKLAAAIITGQTYWASPAIPPITAAPATCYLLPGFDEYLMGYTDRSAALAPEHFKTVMGGINAVYSQSIVIDGQVVGIWKRTIKKNSVLIAPTFFSKPKPAHYRAFTTAAERFGHYLGLKVEVNSEK